MTADDLRAWRAEMGFRQTEAAAALGVSLSMLQKYEREASPIPAPLALACAAVKANLEPYKAPASIGMEEVQSKDGRTLRRAEGRAPRRAPANPARRQPSEDVMEKAATIARLRAEGRTLQEIADEIGISVSWAHALSRKAPAAEGDVLE